MVCRARGPTGHSHDVCFGRGGIVHQNAVLARDRGESMGGNMARKEQRDRERRKEGETTLCGVRWRCAYLGSNRSDGWEAG